MKTTWLQYAEQIRKEIDEMPARKSGKNVERRLWDSWRWQRHLRRACDQKGYRGSLGDWEVLMQRLGQRTRATR